MMTDQPTTGGYGQGLVWGYKLVGVDLTTDDHQGGRYRYQLGEWHHADPNGRDYTTGDCPAWPGDGLCVARTLSGAQSGGARIGASTMLLCGYRPGDVLGESSAKVRVRSLWVHPDPLDPVRVLATPHAYLGGAYLGDADLRGADLGGADLTGANLGGANLGDAYLGDADLTGADLGGAYLTGADLGGANLTGAYLTGAYLGDANLGYATRPPWLPAKWDVTPQGYVVEAAQSAQSDTGGERQ